MKTEQVGPVSVHGGQLDTNREVFRTHVETLLHTPWSTIGHRVVNFFAFSRQSIIKDIIQILDTNRAVIKTHTWVLLPGVRSTLGRRVVN